LPKDKTEVAEICISRGGTKISAIWVWPPSSSVPASFNPKIEPAVFFFAHIYQTNGIASFKTMQLLCHTLTHFVGRDNSVGIVTHYGLDGQGMESWWGLDFPHLSRTDLGPTQPSVQWVPSLIPEGKAARMLHKTPTSSCAEFKERVELYLCSPSGSSWPVLG